MMKTIKLLIIFSIILDVFASSSFAWKTNKADPRELGTHERLSRYAAVFFSTLKTCPEFASINCGKMEEIGLNEGLDEPLTWGEVKPAWQWLINGADKEDAGRLDNMATNSARFNNHFHNPLKPWVNAGLDDWILIPPFHLQGKSSLLWAQDSAYQSDSKWPEGDWTWERTRTYYYTALTSPSETGRQEFFARTLKGLGHQVHLLEDKSVPAHVRNDAHPLPWHIEKWLAENPNVIRCLVENHENLDAGAREDCMQKDGNGEVVLDNEGNPVMNYPRIDVVIPDVLSRDADNLTIDPSFTNYYGSDRALEKTALLTDTDQYNAGDSPSASYSIGLAEYTNGNYFSADTIFAERYDADDRHYFPNPSRAMTNLGDLENNNILPKFVVSEDDIPDGVKCIKKNPPGEEVDCLVRAGYLTNLVDGQNYATYERTFILDAPSHESYVKHLIPRAVGYSAALIDYFFRGRLDIQVGELKYGENSSIIEAKFRVRNLTPSELPGLAFEPIESGTLDLAYAFIPAKGSTKEYHLAQKVYTITNAGDLINSEHVPITAPLNIPAGARDITFTVVFRGKLGGEPDAVAAHVYNFTSSRIAYFYQPNGQPNTSNIFTISPDGSNPYQVTNASVPNPWYFSPTWSKDETMIAFEKERCDDPNPNPADPSCSLQYYHRDIIGINLLSALKYPDNIQFVRNYSGDSVANANFSPDGTKIAALKLNESGLWFSNLVVFDLANNSQWIVNKDDDPDLTSLDWSAPAWSPTGDKIAYYLYRQYDEASRTMAFVRDLFLIDPYSGAKTRLTNDEFNNMEPAWSPDGEKIAFSSDRDGEASMDIWVMDKNGENLRKLFDCTPASCYSPTFSPDGQQVAFTNGSSIYSVGIDGNPYSAKELAQIGDYIGGLSWSPFLVPPTFLDIQANPDIISGGGTAVLSWQSDRATEVDIQGIAEKQPASGTIAVSPATTTTYTLTASGPTGSSKTTITVKVE